MNIQTDASTPDLALWGGLECTVNRVRDNYFSQMDRNGHAGRLQDIERFASLGIGAIRYPVLWERTAPDGVDKADWSWPDERLPALRQLGINPIVGLVHHGSGPRHTSLVDPAFPELLADYAGAVATRYPWVEYYTPVNEICTTARFSGLAGLWYPHGGDEATFIRALLVQCRATVLSMRAIRAVNPHAKLVQTDDLSKTYGTPEMEEISGFFNERRWLAWDLLCGMIDENHQLWNYLRESGAGEDELRWFRDNRCPPDVVGVNYYITSERWLDHRPERYPESHRHVFRGVPHADIEAPRALATPTPGIAPLLMETWERYGLPIAVTEAHIDANREDQMRWLLEIWNAALKARQQGADVRAVTVWALLGSFDWNCLVTECRGYYEPGPFDVRSPAPRPTALATLMRELASKRPLSNPVLQGEGWWRRPGRFWCKPVATRTAVADIAVRSQFKSNHVQPILISGASGTLGSAFKRICEKRNLACHVLTRQEMDITDPASVEAAIVRFKPWAIVNAGGYVRVDEAEADLDRCMRENTLGPTVLALAAIRHALRFMTYSSDLVFDGASEQPYVESDAANPLGVYGRSKLEAEQRVLDADPQALVIRTSAFFGPWDQHNFVTQALNALDVGRPFQAARDVTVSPTYVPDLVNVSLDLLIDRERGVWHLTNGEALSWAELARRACAAAGVSSDRLQEVSIAECGYAARRPGYSAMSSERGLLLPSLDDALKRYVEAVQERANGVSLGHEHAGEAAHYAR
ncbi:family 1 glycosylhydrolase [Massilia sp. CFBP9012]|uniref:family 1 glycosylhydrolase n=1 Tax=Massilia sp. CFBP9012 TaxID=3096531 RepID=UPI002A69E616|nr:family 1 glycosylhydrolase [Massilia sp. CFBP9012]MDY0978176.1 family 1 glycosylhydrolase [Massilia sp. CFBP9012]